MFLTDITERGTIPVLEKVMAFASARHDMLAENVANADTPGYRAKQLDPRAFQATLRRAIADRGDDPHRPLTLRRTRQIAQDAQGRLVATPEREPADNILFHDRTNASLERLMAQVAENVMAFNLAGRLLESNFDGLKTVIRGQV